MTNFIFHYGFGGGRGSIIQNTPYHNLPTLMHRWNQLSIQNQYIYKKKLNDWIYSQQNLSTVTNTRVTILIWLLSLHNDNILQCLLIPSSLRSAPWEDVSFSVAKCSIYRTQWGMYEVSVAIVINYHNLGGLKQQGFIFSQFWRPDVGKGHFNITMLTRPCFLQRLWGDNLFPDASIFWCLLVCLR